MGFYPVKELVKETKVNDWIDKGTLIYSLLALVIQVVSIVTFFLS